VGSPDPAWEAAIQYHDIKAGLRTRPKDLLQLQSIAVKAVLARAKAVIGASKKETRKRTDSIEHRPHAELNIEETLENIMGKPHPDYSDIIVDYKEQKRLDCALMLDTSLSMTGEKLALLAVAATVFAYKLPSEDISIIAFESTANSIKKIRTQLSVERIAQKILDVPAMGYTNIEAALSEGINELALGIHKNRIGILISDGKYTAGNDPLPMASRYDFLHVILTGDFNTDPAASVAMASAGHGRLYKAPNFQSLPRVLSRLIADILA